MSQMIEVNNLTKSFGSSDVLKGINFNVQQGEIFGLVGHNGAGKSTFIHTITGIILKSSGSFKIKGIADDQINQIKSEIGVMPDVANLYEHMTGLQFLQFMGKLSGDSRSKKDYELVLKSVELEGAERKKIKSYSFGMKKKICIAQALLGDPELLILDEPTSGLDPESAINIRNLIASLQKDGKTILLTSHNLDEIDRISDRVAILSDGVIKKLGTPRQLKEETSTEINISIRTEPNLSSEYIKQLSDEHNIQINFVETKEPYILLQVASESDLPRLAKEISNSNYLLYEMKIEQRSLEDVFINT